MAPKTISWLAILMVRKINQRWTQGLSCKAQISTVGAPIQHPGNLYYLLHKTEKRTQLLQTAFIAPSSTKLPTHLFPLSFLWPSTSNMKTVESNGMLKAKSNFLQKEHIWIALHVEIDKKKKQKTKNASGTSSFMLHQFKFQVWNFVMYMKTLHFFVFKKGKAEICPNWSSAFLSLHILCRTFIC